MKFSIRISFYSKIAEIPEYHHTRLSQLLTNDIVGRAYAVIGFTRIKTKKVSLLGNYVDGVVSVHQEAELSDVLITNMLMSSNITVLDDHISDILADTVEDLIPSGYGLLLRRVRVGSVVGGR